MQNLKSLQDSKLQKSLVLLQSINIQIVYLNTRNTHKMTAIHTRHLNLLAPELFLLNSSTHCI